MANSPYRPFKPNPEQLALMPSLSGNTINGMGELNFRRAKPIYWHDPATLHHGELQKWFYTQNPASKAINKAREQRARILDIEVPPVRGEPMQQSAEAWSDDLAQYAVLALARRMLASQPVRRHCARIPVTVKLTRIVGLLRVCHHPGPSYHAMKTEKKTPSIL